MLRVALLPRAGLDFLREPLGHEGSLLLATTGLNDFFDPVGVVGRIVSIEAMDDMESWRWRT